MKELRGTATALPGASRSECIGFLAAVERYPSWYPEVVRSIDVLERDAGGNPSKVHAVLHLARGPLVRDFELVLAVDVAQPDAVALSRIANDASDRERFEVRWRVLSDGDSSTDLLLLELEASLSVPRLLPLGGVGDAIAGGFVTAANRALREGRR
jgi:hypothetical protein